MYSYLYCWEYLVFSIRLYQFNVPQKKKNELGVRTLPYEQKHSNNATCLCNPHVYMRRRDILIRIPPSYRHIVFIINEDIQLMRILWAFIKTMLVFAPKSLLLLWQKIQMPLWRNSWNVEAVEGGWGNKLKMCLVFFSFFYVKANIICTIIQSIFNAVPNIFVKL